MEVFRDADGKQVLLAMVRAIQDNKGYLSEVDGLIGDGDHGMNMNKGFTQFGARIADREVGLAEGLDELGTLLFTEIGGSMGPIYGAVFCGMAESLEGNDVLDAGVLAQMLAGALDSLSEIVEAREGDKTLVDTLSPAAKAAQAAAEAGKGLEEALAAMRSAAEAGRDATRDMVAKFGRSSRLGERSRGVLDAGATSCCLLLCAMADAMLKMPFETKEGI